MLVNDGNTGTFNPTTLWAACRLAGVTDYAVEAEIELIRYTYEVSTGFGIVVRADADRRGYAAGHCGGPGLSMCGPNNWNAFVWSTEDPQHPISAAPFKPEPGWHRYRVEVRGDNIKLYIDGNLYVAVTDSRYLSGPNIGLFSKAAVIRVRSFSVMEP
jgi:hypothetical protein